MKHISAKLVRALLLIALLVTVPAQAALDMFLKIGDIKGESTDSVHKEAIDVLAWSWGMSNSGTTHLGGGAGAGKASFQDLSLTKYVDKASPVLMQKCAEGAHMDTAVLIVRKAGGTTAPVEYITITMTEVMVTSVSTGGSGGEDRLTENITLNFAKVKFEYQPVDVKGGPVGKPIPFEWNIAENVAQ